MTHLERIEIVRKTHAIMCGLLEKDIALVAADPPARTDTETYIALPFEDPEVITLVKHEFTHFFGKTRLHARDIFLDAYYEERKDELCNARSVDDFMEFGCLTCGALDDIRVLSLQELYYPGGADQVRDRWRRMVLQGPASNIILRLMGFGVGLTRAEMPNIYRSHDLSLIAAVTNVRRKGYYAVLRQARILLDKLLHFEEREELPTEGEMAAPVGEPHRLTRQRRSKEPGKSAYSLDQLVPTTKAALTLLDTVAPMSDRAPLTSSRMAMAALGRMSEEMATQVDEEGEHEVLSLARELSSKMKAADPDAALKKAAPSVRWIDVKAHEAEEFVLQPEDQHTVSHLRHSFMKMMDTESQARSFDGSELDIDRFLESRLNHGDADYFIEETEDAGFVLMLLLDMSGSMLRHWNTVSRAAKVVLTATDFPFATRTVWGFSGSPLGGTHIWRFKDPNKGYLPSRQSSDLWGSTPLHEAVPAAIKALQQTPGTVKRLVIITDGNPQTTKHEPPSVLREAVRRAVLDAARHHTQVTALLVDSPLTDDEASRIYGRGRWIRIDHNQHDIFYTMVDIVRASFTTYLKG